MGIAVMLCLLAIGCRSSPILPSDPGYGPKAAAATAGISKAGSIGDRLAALLNILDQKSAEISSLSGRGGEELEAVERSYVKIIRRGLLVTIVRAEEEGEEMEELALNLLPRLEEQARTLERCQGHLPLQGAGGSLEACREVMAKLRDLSGGGSGFAGDQGGVPDTRNFRKRHRPSCPEPA